jgi:hypothetical protein
MSSSMSLSWASVCVLLLLLLLLLPASSLLTWPVTGSTASPVMLPLPPLPLLLLSSSWIVSAGSTTAD